MPKREDIKSILIIGAGPIVIGQACEFDYSGAQACKALREEGYRVILVNSNPATIMTDPKMADATYIEPIEWKTLEKIIEKVLKENVDKVTEYKSGKDKLFGFFVGSVIKESKGKANPALVNDILKKKLSPEASSSVINSTVRTPCFSCFASKTSPLYAKRTSTAYKCGVPKLCGHQKIGFSILTGIV